MGYYVFITRKASMWDEGAEIGLDEWLNYVDSQPELKREVGDDGPGLATLKLEGGPDQDEHVIWFDWNEGLIEVKSPNEEMLRRMWPIAQGLKAFLRGESDETYGPDCEVLTAPLIEGTDEFASIKTLWWRVWPQS